MQTQLTADTVQSDDGYSEFESVIRKRIANVTGDVFTTDVDCEALWSEYISNIPLSNRQHYNCNCCRHFIQKYGSLVTIDEVGEAFSVLWDGPYADVPQFFRQAVSRMAGLTDRSKVTGVFVWSEPVWGDPQKGGWSHLSGTPTSKPYASKLLTASQRAAELTQDFIMLVNGLRDYGKPAVEQALRVLQSDALYRSEKAVGVATWLNDLHAQLDSKKLQTRNNLIWRAVASAPAGFCHVRSTMISTLLDDVVAGLPFDTISRKWAEKMNPLKYRRPTAAPTDGAIKEAERVFEKLGAASALKRRFATLDDVLKTEWLPVPLATPKVNDANGLFGHLKNEKTAVKEVELPPQTITMQKFRRDVLPTATQLEVMVPTIGPFYGLVTAVDPNAVPILMWDGLEGKQRNPVSWYFYATWSHCNHWQLSAVWTPVTACFLSPPFWQSDESDSRHALAMHFALQGSRDKSVNGLALFPETLRSELHAVRSVIEAHSRTGKIEGAETGNANGIAFQKNNTKPLTVRVTSGGRRVYTIDRWE